MADRAIIQQFSAVAAGPLRVLWLGRRPRLRFFAAARRSEPRPSAHAVLLDTVYVEVALPRRRRRR